MLRTIFSLSALVAGLVSSGALAAPSPLRRPMSTTGSSGRRSVTGPMQIGDRTGTTGGDGSGAVHEPVATVVRDNEEVPIVDWACALRNMAGSQELLCDVAGECLQELPQLLSKLEQAVAEGRRSEIGRLSHTIKGAGRTFGSAALQQAARRIEEAAEGGDLSTLPALLPALRGATLSVSAALRETIAAR